MVTAANRAPIVTVNGGKSWSGWYNQPTGQFYHVETDNRFPYWIYSGQQDSGTTGAATRSDYGMLTYRDWHPVGGEERGWDVPDPHDPRSCTEAASVARSRDTTRAPRKCATSRRTSRARTAAVRSRVSSAGRGFSARDVAAAPHDIYTGSQFLLHSTNKGVNLGEGESRPVGRRERRQGMRRGSYARNRAVVRLRRDLHDRAFAARPAGDLGRDRRWSHPVDARRRKDLEGRDAEAVRPPGQSDHARRLVPRSRHSLRGRETTVSTTSRPTPIARVTTARPGRRSRPPSARAISRRWSVRTRCARVCSSPAPTQACSCRSTTAVAGSRSGEPSDCVGRRSPPVQGNDLVIATQGRALWVLDDVTPLRQLTAEAAKAPARLFAPAPAIRVRANENRDTPLPPETPIARNPPAGAVLDYVLKSAVTGAVTLEILDAQGATVRAFSSAETKGGPEARPYFTERWINPPAPPSTARGPSPLRVGPALSAATRRPLRVLLSRLLTARTLRSSRAGRSSCRAVTRSV